MPPSPLRPADPVCARTSLSLPLGRLIAAIGIASLLVGSILVGDAVAETPSKVASKVATTKSPTHSPRTRLPPRPHPRSSLLPQTRYTVRKQIESIEPITWLERYGKVQVRKLER